LRITEYALARDKVGPARIAKLRSLLPPPEDGRRGTSTLIKSDGTAEQRPIEGGP
jgi:hypothetical protein